LFCVNVSYLLNNTFRYRVLFIITFSLQLTALTPLFLLGFLVPRLEESIADVTSGDTQKEGKINDESGGDEEETAPLLVE
jgi:hypothetical protein